jgi:hypothetical protein
MHTGDVWPGPGRVLIARTATFEQLGKAIDDVFARWDHKHLHEFTLADGAGATSPTSSAAAATATTAAAACPSSPTG